VAAAWAGGSDGAGCAARSPRTAKRSEGREGGRDFRHDFRFEHHGNFEHGRSFDHHGHFGHFGHHDHFDRGERGRDRRLARWNDGRWHPIAGAGGHDREGAIQPGRWQRTPGLGEGTHRVSDFQGQWHL
jgi:hypothetical protein